MVEDRVAYPLTTTLLSGSGANTVRGDSFFGDLFVYILFDDKTDPYWARSLVVESLNQVQSRLPPGANAALGPDASGVGWIYQYTLVDRSGRNDLGQLRALNDWFLKFALKTFADVAEIARIGGMVRQYRVVLDPDRMRALGVTQAVVVAALRNANQMAGGSVVDRAEAEYMCDRAAPVDARRLPLDPAGADRGDAGAAARRRHRADRPGDAPRRRRAGRRRQSRRQCRRHALGQKRAHHHRRGRVCRPASSWSRPTTARSSLTARSATSS